MNQFNDRNRQPYIDGIRGIAAIYVVLHHAYSEVQIGDPDHWLVRLLGWLAHGHYAVAVFIVVSGYCLMGSITETGNLRGGIFPFLRRRAERILPPYYLAMLFSLALIALCPSLRNSTDPRWVRAVPAFSYHSIVSHIFMIQNLRPWWAFRIDPPMWTVATESQIYLIFPALLWVMRRHGMSATVALALVLGLIPSFVLGRITEDGYCPWYLGLFGFGMAANWMSNPRNFRNLMWSDRVIWFSPIALIVCLTLANGSTTILSDIMVGAASAGFIYYFSTTKHGGRLPIFQILESAPLRSAGSFSYSLYLLHYPLQALQEHHLKTYGVSTTWRLAIHLSVGTCSIMITAYLFYLVFERPFLNSTAEESVMVQREMEKSGLRDK